MIRLQICMHEIALVIRYSWNSWISEIWESTDGLSKNAMFLKKHINVAYEQTKHVTNAFSAVIV